MQVFGIPACDSVKKARKWLDAEGLPYQFHDYKKAGVDEAILRDAVAQFGWENVLNRRGTTWRKLASTEQDAIVDADAAIEAMIAHPSMIKRPLVKHPKGWLLGFNEAQYREILGG